ncbi:MAG: DUF4359 domain-containing protein [Bacteroidaceae bacterium]|nr:DUF4359 domain-containing protein [Bacteroidaceae bacterium]
MKRITKAIVAVLAVSAILVGTCPGKEKHQSVIKDKLGEVIKKELPTEEIDSDNPFAKVLTALGTQLLDGFIENNLKVKNYGLFSLGKAGNPSETISIGILGHVFITPNEKHISLGNTNFEYNIDDGLNIRID